MWIVPFVLWLFLTGIIAWRDLPRITQDLEKTHYFARIKAIKYAKLIAILIYFPVFVTMALSLWLGETHQVGTCGVAILWLVGPLWFWLGYSFTGGRKKVDLTE